MFIIKLNSGGLYFCGDIEGEACYTTGEHHSVKYKTTEELDIVVEKYEIDGYSVGVVK